MCVLCVDEILKKLTYSEIRKAGFELLNTTKDIHEKQHIMEKLRDLEYEHLAYWEPRKRADLKATNER